MKRLFNEPLLHFLLVGGLLFGINAWLGPEEAAGGVQSQPEIRLTAGEIEWLVQTWTRQRQRAPDQDELKGMVAEYLKEALLAREAVALGLDENDTIVRRRLAQKMKFLVEDTTRLAEPEEEILRQYFQEHQTSYQRPVILSFSQRFFATEHAARSALQQLYKEPAADVGERSLLEQEIVHADAESLASRFGEEFATQVIALEEGKWLGPVTSSYGFHLVIINARQEAQPQEFNVVFERVQEDWYRQQQERATAKFFAALLEKYDVVIDDSIRPLIGPMADFAQ